MVIKVEKPPAPPAEQGGTASPGVESLDAIATAAAQLDAPPAPDAKAEQQELAEVLKVLRAAALPFAPDHVQEPIGLVWSDKQLLEVGKAIVAVCRMHGFTASQFFEGYGPYIQLAMALGIPALATLKILKTPPPPPPAQVVHGQQQPA